MQHEWAVEVAYLANFMLDVGAVVGDGAVDFRSTAHQIAKLAPETISDGADPLVTLGKCLEVSSRILHVLDALIEVETVIQVEGLLDGARTGSRKPA